MRNKIITDYEAILPTGKQNAIASRELATLLGFSDIRQLQQDIAKSRDAGQIILSSTTGGYYMPANDDEVAEFIAVLRSRAINTFKALKSATKYLKTDTKQLSLDDFIGIDGGDWV